MVTLSLSRSMPTNLTKPVSRHVARANLKVTLTAEGVNVREPRKRTTYGPLSYSAILYYAAKQMAEAVREEKARTAAIRSVL